MNRREIEAIKEAVADFIQWTHAKQRAWKGLPKKHPATPDCFSDFDCFQHPGAESPRINPDYEWLHRQTWIHESLT